MCSQLQHPATNVHIAASMYLFRIACKSVQRWLVIQNSYVLVWPLPLAQVLWHPQLIFPFKTLFLNFYLNFQQQKSLKNQYLPHSESKYYQINSIKSCSSRSFQLYQRHIPIPPKFSATIQFNFQWRNHSIFKNFCTTSPNIMEPSPCTPPRWELSKDIKNTIWSMMVWWIS